MDKGSHSGVSFQQPIHEGGNPNLAYFVTKANILPYLIPAHYIGHIFGLRHNFKEHDDIKYNWGSNWIIGGSYCRSIMDRSSRSHMALPYYTNPKIEYPLGNPLGNIDTADSARYINEVKHIIASYRSHHIVIIDILGKGKIVNYKKYILVVDKEILEIEIVPDKRYKVTVTSNLNSCGKLVGNKFKSDPIITMSHFIFSFDEVPIETTLSDPVKRVLEEYSKPDDIDNSDYIVILMSLLAFVLFLNMII
jgi:hypothetical protein